MSEFISNHLYTSLPAQKIPASKKNKDWKEQCVQAVCSMGSSRVSNGRSTWAKKQTNYDLVASILNESDFNVVLNPYGTKESIGNQPAKLRNINLIVSKINLLKGEEMVRPFPFQVVATSGNALIEKDVQKKKMVVELAYKKLAKELGISLDPQVNPETGEETPVTFEGIEKYAQSSMTDVREQWGNNILNYLKHKENLALKFNEGWEHGLIAAEEIYYVGISNGQPKVRVCNPLNCEYDRNPDNPNIEEGDWFKEDRWMTVGQIIDEFGEFLTDAQIDKLEHGTISQGLSNQMFPGFAYSENTMAAYEKGSFSNRTKASSTHILVSHVVWKSMKQIGFLTMPDGEETIVTEEFKLTPEMKEMGLSVEWRWIGDVWQGTRLGANEFINITPVPNQIRFMDEIGKVNLPYIGRIYNSTNSEQTSFVDLIKPHLYLYITIWFRLESEVAKAKGKKMVMDMAMIPKSQGIDLDKWMYLFDNVGIAFINSFEEGKDKFQGQVSQFNQFQNIDMTLSQSVGQYLTILSKIEQTIDRIVGITPQREGSVHQSETVGGVQTAVANSSLITEPWFYIHNEVKKKVLTNLLEAAKFAYPSSKKINFITDDFQRLNMEIDMEKFSDSDYGVFVSNTTKEHSMMQKLEGLAQQALASGAAVMSDIVKIYKANSISEIANLIEESEAKRQAQLQQQQQMDQQMNQANIEAQAQEKAEERAFLAEQNQLDRDNEIRRAVITATAFDTDTADSGQLEALKYGELALKQTDSQNKTYIEERKLNAQLSENQKDRDLKREELKVKKQIEDKKAATALKNKTSGEK